MILDFLGGPSLSRVGMPEYWFVIHPSSPIPAALHPSPAAAGSAASALGAFTFIPLIHRMPERVFRVRAPRRRGKSGRAGLGLNQKP